MRVEVLGGPERRGGDGSRIARARALPDQLNLDANRLGNLLPVPVRRERRDALALGQRETKAISERKAGWLGQGSHNGCLDRELLIDRNQHQRRTAAQVPNDIRGRAAQSVATSAKFTVVIGES